MSALPAQADFAPAKSHLRSWTAIGAGGAALAFLFSWSQAAAAVAHGASEGHILGPFEMSFTANGLYLALGLGLLASAMVGALAGGAAAAVAALPSKVR